MKLHSYFSLLPTLTIFRVRIVHQTQYKMYTITFCPP